MAPFVFKLIADVSVIHPQGLAVGDSIAVRNIVSTDYIFTIPPTRKRIHNSSISIRFVSYEMPWGCFDSMQCNVGAVN